MTASPKKKKQKRKKKKSNDYFTMVHQDAIVEYASTEDNHQRNKLYVEIIKPVFKEMIDKIVYTYKFTHLPNIEIHKKDCEVHLATVLGKFEQEKGHKAFSYFSVITRNFFSGQVKKNSKKQKKEIQHDEISKQVESEYLATENSYIEDREREEFSENLWKEIKEWETLNLKPNERKVLEAIKILLKDPENSIPQQIYTKKAVYMYLREITGLNTKQIHNNLNKFRSFYDFFKKQWHDM